LTKRCHSKDGWKDKRLSVRGACTFAKNVVNKNVTCVIAVCFKAGFELVGTSRFELPKAAAPLPSQDLRFWL